MSERRIGVYICYCGGNISDYVDCERVRDAIENEEGVVVAKTTMFACSDAAQQEIIDDIREQKLDGLVVASCSPTLHLFTFRGVAVRAGLNPYLYIQVNLREQCSWAHTDLPKLATEKAIHMVKAGIAKVLLTQSLERTRIDTVPRALVVGAGISGLRTALALSDLGISAFV
ncbi:MAG: CoB--CoM heterodisulfide reductase iron-sulfur subunit A family protein, partial [Candidatus Latescibacteria bacterium]|nr:CoB--CoM heterodisulfide reductase iron-sulfur subunit A family protein [Candidatus Latescibacterota bacterium]